MFKTHAAILLLFIAVKGIAQDGRQGPEDVIRAFYKAVYSGDKVAFERLTVADPRRGTFLREGSRNEAGLRELIDDPGSLQIKMKRPMMSKGRAIEPDGNGDYPAGTTALYMTAHGRGPTMITLRGRLTGGESIFVGCWR